MSPPLAEGAAPVIDRFELIQRAGAGGMGEVWRARDRVTGQEVALKLLLGSDPLLQARFAREAEGLARVVHPDVVRFLAHGVDPHRGPWLAMQWLEGESLSSRLRRGRMTPADATQVARVLCGALEATHALGLVHRDLKPANVILRAGGGRPCLVDFGLVRSVEGESALTHGLRIGTPRYMSPEQVRGAPPADARADLWALGTLLYECLAGAPVFDGKESLAILAKVLLEPIEPIAQRAPGVPRALAELVGRLLSRDRNQRPASASEVALALDRVAFAEGLARTQLAPVGVSRGARRLAAVLVVAPPPGATSAEVLGLAHTVASVAKIHRARAERVRSEGVVLTLPGRRGAGEQAIVAARCGLAVRASFPEAHLAIAFARTRTAEPGVSGVVGVGAAIDRASALLASEAARVGLAVEGGAARLLGSRFVIEERPDGLVLRGARDPSEGGSPGSVADTPLVGRAEELTVLLDRAGHAITGRGASSALVVGDVGVGKTRLAGEAIALLRRAHPELRIWTAQGDPSRDASPFWLAGGLLRSATAGADSPRALEERLAAIVAAAVPPPGGERVVAALLELGGAALGAIAPPLRAERGEPTPHGDRLRHGLAWFIDAATRPSRAGVPASPLVVVIDDAHWGDRATAEWLARTLDLLGERRLFVLAIGRPGAEERMAPFAPPGAILRVGDLADAELGRLARAALAQVHDPDRRERLAQSVVAQAGGSPLFACEILHEMVRGRVHAMPASVLALAEERLLALPEPLARLLRAASAFGRSFAREGLPSLLPDESPAGIDASLAALVADRWIVAIARPRLAGTHELAFRHGVLREAAYAQMSEEDRVRAHDLAATWLEARGERDAAVIAGHLAAARRPADAAPHLARAAEQALAGSDFEGAMNLAQRAIAGALAPTDHARAWVTLAEVHRWRNEHADALGAARSAMAAATRGSDAWFAAAGERSLAGSRLRRLPELVATAAELETALTDAPSAACVAAVSRAAMLLLHANLAARAGPLYAWLDQVAQLELEPLAASRAAFAFAWRAHAMGDWVEYARLLGLAVADAERGGDLRTACQLRANCGHALVELGDFAGACGTLEPALDLALRLGLAPTVALCRNNLGLALGRSGDLTVGIAMERMAAEAYRSAGDGRLEAGCRIYLAALLLAGERVEEAHAECTRAIELAAASPLLLPHALAQLADVARARGDAAGAMDAARRAISAIHAAGRTEGSTVAVHLAVAEALLAAGDPDGAREQALLARAAVVKAAARIEDAARRARYLTSQNADRIRELSGL